MLPINLLQVSDLQSFDAGSKGTGILPDTAIELHAGFAELMQAVPQPPAGSGASLPAGGNALPSPAPPVTVAGAHSGLPAAPVQGPVTPIVTAGGLAQAVPQAASPSAARGLPALPGPAATAASTPPPAGDLSKPPVLQPMPERGVAAAGRDAVLPSVPAASQPSQRVDPAQTAPLPPVPAARRLAGPPPFAAAQRTSTPAVPLPDVGAVASGPGKAGLRITPAAAPSARLVPATPALAPTGLAPGNPALRPNTSAEPVLAAAAPGPRPAGLPNTAGAEQQPVSPPPAAGVTAGPVGIAVQPHAAPATDAPLPPQGGASMPLIETPVRDPAWNERLGERLLVLASNRLQSAEIRVTPAELGPIRVQLALDDGGLNVNFQAQHAVTREAIEQAMPRLRELFAESGLQLQQGSVSEQGQQGDRGVQHGGRDQQRPAAAERGDEAGPDAGAVDEQLSEWQLHVADGRVDTFA